MKNRLAWQIRNAVNGDDDHAEIKLYAEVGESFWFDSVSAQEFTDELDGLDVSKITLRINSPGGSVFDGVAMYSALKLHRATVTAVVEGLAASIATIVMLAADTVQMTDAAMVMIHNPWGMAVGEAKDMRKTAETLDELRDMLIGVYAGKTGKPAAEIGALMDEEKWFRSAAALEFGIVDEVLDTGSADDDAVAADETLDEAAAHAAFDARAFDRFQNTPRELVAAYRAPAGIAARASGRDPLRDLRAAGRVLSATNRDRLESARSAIDEVLNADEGSSSSEARAGMTPGEAAGGARTMTNDDTISTTPEHAARVREILTTL